MHVYFILRSTVFSTVVLVVCLDYLWVLVEFVFVLVVCVMRSRLQGDSKGAQPFHW